jgi:hypothetical protein
MKYLKKYEGFDIKNIPYEEEQFKKLVKSLDPENYNKYYNMYKRKGLEAAKKSLIDNVEAKKTFDKEIKKIKRYDNQTKNDYFGLAKDDIKYYAPIAKETKDLIKEVLLNNKIRKQFYKLGITNITGSPSEVIGKVVADNLVYELKLRKDSYEVNFGLDNKKKENEILKLGDTINLIETSLNGGKWLSDLDDEFKLLKMVYLLNKINNPDIRLSTRVLFNSRVDFDAHFGKLVKNEIYCYISHSISGNPFNFLLFDENFEMEGKIIKMNKEEAVYLRKEIIEFVSKNLKKCTSYIQNNIDFSKFNEFRNTLIPILYNMLERSDDYYGTIKIIKDNFPLTWELMQKQIPEDSVKDVDDLIDMGF